ncbi:serine hydrolase domain-containing protein [Stakelama tenebrarum]|uniref:Beta-lactamase family protein n=1 Tax=Stakelama tenebrarum TaxID=2711215 RepID=A0A6G6Y435_9SPHN|nr:serine hydrolase domain-containing protein [Sphingosinithalassobacter tenebrarum]QIG79373.1 beta-lactamase family protein [Sphingosinithalassobacter tenebrarum]
MRLPLSLALAALLTACAPGAQAQSLPVETVAEAARNWVAEGKAPGIAIGVMQGHEIVLARGYGLADIEHDVAVTPETVFRIGSVTKQFTAAAALRLAEAGPLTPDMLPGPASLYQLLGHTGGVTSFTNGDVAPGEGWSRRRGEAEMLAMIAGFAPRFAPGAGWDYSNSGYYLVGAAIERASGMPLGAYLNEAFFVPLGLDRTALDDERDIVPGRAIGYAADPEAPGGFVHAAWVSMSVPGGAGAMRSTVPDLLRWQDALLHDDVLPPQMRARMLTPTRLSDGSLARRGPEGCRVAQYGLGVYLDAANGVAHVSHYGVIAGYRAYLASFPERGLAVAILTNGESDLTPLVAQVEALLIGANPIPLCPAEDVARMSRPEGAAP